MPRGIESDDFVLLHTREASKELFWLGMGAMSMLARNTLRFYFCAIPFFAHHILCVVFW